MQNSDFRTRITCLYGSQPPSVAFECKTAHFGPEQVSMDPRYHLSFCVCTTACLASELLVSMGPSLHLWFLHAKERLWTRITSLYGYQTSPIVLCMQNSVISILNTSLYGIQPTSVVLFIQKSDLWTEIACVCGSQTSPVIFCVQNSVPSIRINGL